MSQPRPNADQQNRLGEGAPYLLIGAGAAIVSLFLIPIVGLIAVYCGYKLHVEADRRVAGVLIGGAGAIGVLWIVYLAVA